MFAFFETRIRPTLSPGTPPPPGLLAFYWHFVRQTRGLYAAMFATGLAVALIDTSIPVFIGRLVAVMQRPIAWRRSSDRCPRSSAWRCSF